MMRKLRDTSLLRCSDTWLMVGAFVVYMLEWLMFAHSVDIFQRARTACILRGIIDSMLLFLPWIIIFKRQRWIVPVVMWLVSCLFLVDTLYNIFFGDSISFRTLSYVGNFNPLTFTSVMVAVKPYHYLYILLPIVFTAYFVYLTKRKEGYRYLNLSIGKRLISLLALFLAYVIVQFMFMIRIYHYCQDNYMDFDLREEVAIQYFGPIWSCKNNIEHVGLPMHNVTQIISLFNSYHSKYKFTPADRRELDAVVARRRPLFTYDSIYAANRGKNLIFIIVESLNGYVIDMKAGGREVTPTLNALIREDATLWTADMDCQIEIGASSDGQFILNTGLLPMKEAFVAMDFKGNSYHSIASELGRTSVEAIFEEPSLWNHHITTQQYGYDKLLWEKDIKEAGLDASTLGRDRAILRYAAEVCRELPEPFFMEVTTISMHLPFNEEAALSQSDDFNAPSISAIDKKYLKTVNYFDRCLGEFIEQLKRDGIYDRSVIVITSDHNVRSNDNYALGEGPVVFMAVNAGKGGKIERPSGQVDIYPTILHIMGVTPKWTGLGYPLTAEMPEDVESHEELKDLSARIIKSNALGKFHR